MNGIYAERSKRLDTVTLNGAIAAFPDVMEKVVLKAWEIVWEIVNDPMAERMEVLAVLREIRSANSDVFEKLFDAGVFERKRGLIWEVTIRNTSLAEEKKLGDPGRLPELGIVAST